MSGRNVKKRLKVRNFLSKVRLIIFSVFGLRVGFTPIWAKQKNAFESNANNQKNVFTFVLIPIWAYNHFEKVDLPKKGFHVCFDATMGE